MWINLITGKVCLTPSDIRQDSANVSFPVDLTDAVILSAGYSPVTLMSWGINPLTERAVELAPVEIDGVWTQQWATVALSADEIAVNQAALQAQIILATQSRLDAFAHTRNYDGILSACSYATSSIPKFAAEGQAAVNARDATWAALYTMMGKVESGAAPIPTSFADVEPSLPALEWPV